MIYRIGIKGYVLVEADSREEALEKADNEDYIEETWWYAEEEEDEE